MYYRKDLYEKKGLKVPTTFEHMVENCKALTEEGRFGAALPLGSNGAMQWMSTGFYWADGGKLLDDNFKVIVDSPDMKPRMVRYLDTMKKLQPYMPTGMTQALFGTVLGQYSGSQIAHAPYAGRLIEVMEDRAPDLADKTGYFLYPDSQGKAGAVTFGCDGWVLLKTPMQDEAYKFMEWFTENQYINFLHTSPLHFQPPRMDVYDDPRWRANALIKKHAGLVEFMRNILTNKDVIIRSIDTEGPRPDLRGGKMFESYAMAEAVQNRLLKNMPAAEAVDLMAQKYRSVL